MTGNPLEWVGWLFQWFRRLSALVAKAPSAVYAAVYFMCIPVFATVYTCFPDDFFHTTIKYEASLKDDAQDILADLREVIVKTCKGNYKSSRVESNGWRLDVDEVTLDNLVYEDDKFTFNIGVSLQKGEGKSKEKLKTNGYKAVINRQFSAALPKNDEGTEWTLYHYVTVSEPDIIDFDPAVLFPLWFRDPKGRTRILSVPEPLFDKMNALAKAHEGFPGHSSGSWWRMFYLSAATVTTLGYGDITPISPTTRFLTSLEAILGVLFIGLFLTALSYEASGSQRSPSPPTGDTPPHIQATQRPTQANQAKLPSPAPASRSQRRRKNKKKRS